MKENEYVVIDDIYFMKVDGDKYLIEDKELSKLIVKYRCLEREYENARNRFKKYSKGAEVRVKKYYTLAHTYKIELGRCRRKLTKIYKLFPFAEYAFGNGAYLKIPFKNLINWL